VGSPGYVPVSISGSGGALFGELKRVCWAMEGELGDYGRDLMIEMQPILERRMFGKKNAIVWALDEVHVELLALLRTYAKYARELLIMPTQQWTKPLTIRDTHTDSQHLSRTGPEFSISVYLDATDSSVVGTEPSSTRKYVWTNWGTKERHQKAGKGPLVFTKGYSPSTYVGSLTSGKHSNPVIVPDFSQTVGSVGPKFRAAVYAQQCRMNVTQNSVTPRRFDLVVAELLQPQLESDVAKAMARALRKIGKLGRYGTVNTQWGKEFKFTPGYQKWNIQPYLFKKRFSQSSNKWR